MQYIIGFHFESSFKELILPEINNQSICLLIEGEYTDLDEDIKINLNIFDEKWYLIQNDQLHFVDFDNLEIELKNGDLIKAEWIKTKMNITFNQLNEKYFQFHKYLITDEIITIGRIGYENMIAFDFENNVSGHHAELGFRNGIYGIYDKSRNGTYLNGKRVGRYKSPSFKPLSYGDEVYIFGLKIIYLGDILAINCDYVKGIQISLQEKKGDYELNDICQPIYSDIYDRSPRKSNLLDKEQINIEMPPNPVQNKKQSLIFTIGPSLTMVIPMVVGVLFTQWSYAQSGTAMNSAFMYMGIITSVTSAIIGTGWALANLRHSKKQADEAESLRISGYKSYIDKTEKLLHEKKSYNLETLKRKYASNEECLKWIEQKNHRLWENNSRHEDFLTIAIGKGKISNPNVINVPKERFSLINDPLEDEPFKLYEKYKEIDDAPILLSFKTTKLLGLVGKNREKILLSIISQLVTRYSYNEVKIGFLYSENNVHLNSFKWIPHTWSDDRKIRMVASSTNDCREILYYINSEIRNRIENDTSKIPHYILFLEKSDILEDDTLVKNIITEDLGISLVILSDRIENLPNECNEILEDDQLHGYYYLDEKEGGNNSVVFDYVDNELFDFSMKQLSNFRIKEYGTGGAIPDMITYFDMVHVGKIENMNIYRKWLENRSYQSMKSLIGFKAGNQPVYLDIHEKAHGPHGLVAGTTGSGKSELLQTYILSLALNYHPYEISFILIDYKGGGMAQSFEKLPHTSGIITNLGGNQTNRALSSINSEIRRRQHIFNENHIKHIDEYIELFRNQKVEEPIPHLIIIADEFAELKKEQPEFVRELVSASRIGRSLGVHLILATQKPNGVVDDEIWGNSKFRLCLRVQDRQDSNDMIKRTDAAYVTNVGRGFLQVGNNEIFEEFQSAWSGATYQERDEKAMQQFSVRLINNLGQVSIKTKNKKKKDKDGISQLDVAVQHICKVFADNKIKPIKPVWLKPLSSHIVLNDLKYSISQNGLNMVLGLVDDPIHQRQFPLQLNLIDTGHILIGGGISSGKTTLLKTAIYSLLANNDVDHLNVYIADFGSRTLNVFQNAPQIGGVLFENEDNRIKRLIKMLNEELNRRKIHFAKKGIANFKEYYEKNDDYPAIVFIIDNYAAFNEANSTLENDLILLGREGTSYGIFLIFTLLGANEIKSKIRNNFQTGIGLQLSDRFEYESILQERIEFMPEPKISGRGLIKLDQCYEFQTALPFDETDSELINQSIQSFILDLTDQFAGKKAFSIPTLPSDMSISSFLKIPNVNDLRNSHRYLPLGFDVDEIEIISQDLSKGMCYTVSGPTQSGKSTLLAYIAALKHNQDAEVYAITNKTEGKRNLQKYGIKKVIETSEELFEFMNKRIVPVFKERNIQKHEFLKESDKDVYEFLDIITPIFILIDDLPFFMDLIYNSEKNMSDFIELCFRKGKNHGIYFIATLSTNDYQLCLQRPAFRIFTENKDGLHFGGMADNQRIFDFDLSISQKNKKLKPGNSYINCVGKTVHLISPNLDL